MALICNNCGRDIPHEDDMVCSECGGDVRWASDGMGNDFYYCIECEEEKKSVHLKEFFKGKECEMNIFPMLKRGGWSFMRCFDTVVAQVIKNERTYYSCQKHLRFVKKYGLTIKNKLKKSKKR